MSTTPPSEPQPVEPQAAESTAAPRSRKRTGIIAGVAIATLAVVGGGTWAAVSFLAEGPDAAEALPATTIAFASVDLDPSGAQKIEAARMLAKFPAIREEIDLSADTDLRKQLFESAQEDGTCADLDYAEDVEPWLGTTFTIGAIEGEDAPTPFLAVSLEDPDAAEDGLKALAACGDDEGGAFAISGDHAYLTQEQAEADAVVKAVEEKTLAEDETYARWAEEVGDRGFVSMYAAPAAGEAIADALGSFDPASALPEVAAPEPLFSDEEIAQLRQDLISTGMTPAEADEQIEALTGSMPGTAPTAPDPEEMSKMIDEMTAAYADFEGGAATIRFSDGGLEVVAAMDQVEQPTLEGIELGDAGAIAASLPDDTLAAVALAPGEGGIRTLVENAMTGIGQDPAEIWSQGEQMLGLDLPADVDTLFGEGFALALGGGFDAEAMQDPTTVPFAMKVRGDAEAIETIVSRLTEQAGMELSTKAEGDYFTIGGESGFVETAAGDGGLGDSETFTDVVPDAEGASSVVFVDFDGADGWLAALADDAKAKENLEPLSAVGFTTNRDEGVDRLRIRLTTD